MTQNYKNGTNLGEGPRHPVWTVNSPYSSSNTATDSFGRLRTSNPLTLFESSHRYRDNALWATLAATNGTANFNSNQGLMDLVVTAESGSSVIRETKKVFSYQPGKSLFAMNSFVFAPAMTNLRQRVGYFGANNGVFLQLDDNTLSIVKRTSVSGVLSDISVTQNDWNIDKLDGSGISEVTLDITKAQIFWVDFEWLGVGCMRAGFIIDGKILHCHSFHHANMISTTYITTACLPLRYEITNKAATSISNTLKQICSTVISEGGHELFGNQQAIGTALGAPRNLSVANQFYPIVTIRLKSANSDAIVVLSALSMIGKTTSNYAWKLITGGTTAGGTGTWISAGNDSSVEYKLDATSITGGKTLASGFFSTTNQSAKQIDLPKDQLFKNQLERDSLNNVYYEMTLAIASDISTGSSSDVYASLDWEEITK